MQVSPRSAPAGSQFVFSGSGFQPTQLSLIPKTGTRLAHNITVGSADTWQYKVRSLTGDKGMWVAVFTDPQTSCTAKAVFWVTAATDGSTGPAAAIFEQLLRWQSRRRQPRGRSSPRSTFGWPWP